MHQRERSAASQNKPGHAEDRRGRRQWIALVLLFFVTLGPVLPCVAADIVIVKASDAEPYTQAETELRQRLTDQHHAVRSMLVKDISQNGVQSIVGNADAVVAIGTSAARWLHEQLPASVKLAYCMVNNASEAGLLQGRGAGGVTTEVALSAQVALIAEALPHARAIGALYRSDSAQSQSGIDALKSALPSGWQVDAVAVNDFPSVAAAIDALTQKNIDVIWTSADQKLYDTASVRVLLLAALRRNIPVWGFSPAFVRAGALLGVGVNPRAQADQAADMVLKLIAGDTSAALQAQAPREYEIAVNLIVAQQLGIQIPDSLSSRATYVFRPEN
jgi:ABC-type uncharacterized transport system substrate-binding protein